MANIRYGRNIVRSALPYLSVFYLLFNEFQSVVINYLFSGDDELVGFLEEDIDTE